MQGKKVLVTGGAGSIGSELVRQLSVENEVYILDINETEMFELAEELKCWGRVGDVRDEKIFEEIVEEFGTPDFVFHCGALKHVTPNELDPIEAVKTNILGTWNVVRFCKRYGCKLINISTDKVVNGESVMGLTKKIAERLVKNAGFTSVRFGNVLGSRGSVIPIWQRQIAQGKPITVTDKKMARYMMTIPQACELLVRAAEIGGPGDILVMDMGEPKNIYDLAREFAPGHPIEIIGSRPGETLNERLMTIDEALNAVKVDNFWIINDSRRKLLDQQT